MFVNLDIAYSHENKASLVLLFNQGKILSVSRKYDKNIKGLAGGKVDKGETYLNAAIRETKEETGLDVFCLIPVYGNYDGNYYCVVYLAQWKGDIKPGSEKETGVVEWVDFEEIKTGEFGEFNTNLELHLKKIGLL